MHSSFSFSIRRHEENSGGSRAARKHEEMKKMAEGLDVMLDDIGLSVVSF